MNELERMVADGAVKLFAEQCGRTQLEQLDLGKFPAELWDSFVHSGFEMLLCAPDGGLVEATAAALQLVSSSGYYRVPLPVRETLVARALLNQAGMDQPQGLTVALRLEDCEVTQNGSRLSGKVNSVPWARHATSLVAVIGRPGEEHVCVIDTRGEGVSFAERVNIASEPRDDVLLHAANCCVPTPFSGSASLLALYNAQMTAAALTGAAEATLDMAVQYANDRIQFGHPLGHFQAVQQSLAIVAGEVGSARAACALAFRTSKPMMRTVAISKMRAGVAASVAANASHQVHGAIGVTQEYGLHYLTRRLWAWRAENGTESHWAQVLGRDVVRRGSHALWPDITATGLIGAQERTAAGPAG